MFSTAAYLEQSNMFGIRLGLDATRELFRRAGNPEKYLKFIHLAGTNGKGSTAAMLEHAFRSAGLVTGLYTSPHLIDVRERFRVNGKAIPEEEFNTLGEELAAAAEGGSFSYFEFTTVLAALIFCRAGVDVVIWETGLGGRLDSTNAVMPCAAAITNIALDHQAMLGETIARIAGEKAGILKPGVPLFCNRLVPEAEEVIAARAAELGVEMIKAGDELPELVGYVKNASGRMMQEFNWQGDVFSLPLLGSMQRENFRMVYNIIRYFGEKWHFNARTALLSLCEVSWPGRCQLVGDKLLVDGGHNPDGVTALTAALAELYPGVRHPVIYGAFRDKAFAECIKLLSQTASCFIFVPVPACGRPAASAEELLALAAECGVPGEYAEDLDAALEKGLQDAGPGVCVVSGSLYLAGEVLRRKAPAEQVLDL